MDDILGEEEEESDNESEGRGKEKPGNEEMEDDQERQQQQQPGAGQAAGGGPGPQALGTEEKIQTPCSEASLPASVSRWDTELHCKSFFLFSIVILFSLL